MITTDNQFIDWYIDTLTTKEVTAALKAVEIKVNKKKNDHDMLKSAWKKGRNSIQVAISAYFDEQHKEAREEINGKSRDECRNELDDLVTRFGVRSMAFVLIINSDRFMKEIGYQLVNERGDEVESVEDDGDDDSEAGDGAQDGNGSEVSILNKLEKITDAFYGGQIIEDVEKIDAAVNSLFKSWQDFKKYRSQRQEYMLEISNYLRQLKEHNTVLEYFLVLPGFPLEVELYKNVVPSDYAEVKGLLNDVYGICQEASLLLAKEDSNIHVAKQLTCFDERLKQNCKLLNNILEQPEQPEQKQLEGLQEEGTVNIKPDEGSKSLECQAERVSVAEDEDKPGDTQKAASSDEDVGSASVEWCEPCDIQKEAAPPEINDDSLSTEWHEPEDVHSIEDERILDDIQTAASTAEEEECVPEQLTKSGTITAESPESIKGIDGPLSLPEKLKTEELQLEEPPHEEPITEEPQLDIPPEELQLDDPPPEKLITEEQQPIEQTPDEPPSILAHTVPQKTDALKTSDPQVAAANAEAAATVALVKPTITTEVQETLADLSDAERCFWEALQDGNLATAYWLTREIEDNPVEDASLPPAPSWLLLSAFLGREASWSDIEEKDYLYNICMEHSDHLDALPEQMGISERDLALLLAAAALRPTLFAPETLAGSWVEKALSLVNNPTDPFSELMQTVLDFSLQGKSLDRKLLRQAVHSIDWQEQAKSVSKEVTAWRNEVSVKRITFAPATKTLHKLAGPESFINNALDTVIKNDFTKQDIVAAALDRFLSNRKNMNELMRKTTEELYKRKTRIPEIDGHSVQQIIRPLCQLRKFFIKWLDSVQSGDIQEQKNDWWYKKTWDFQRTFKNCWDAVEHELTGYPDHEVGIKGKAIRSYAFCVFNLLLEELAEPLSEQEVKQVRDWEQVLSRPLLLLCGAPFDEEGYIDLTQPFMVKDSLLQAVLGKCSLKDALRVHLKHNDFQLAELVIQELQDSGDPQADELYQEYKDLESHAQILLKDKIGHTRNLIVQATIDHVLTEEIRSQMEGQLLSIEEQETRQLFLPFQEMDEIAEKIYNLRGERHKSLHDNIKQLLSELDDRDVVSGKQNNLVIAKKHLERSKGALRNGDLPLADEFLHYAERAIDTGMENEVEEKPDKVNYVNEFVGVLNELYRYLESEGKRRPWGLVEHLSKGKSEAGLDMKRVPGARYKEIESGLDAWLKIKRYGSKQRNAGSVGEQLRKLLEYVGFQRPQVEYKDSDKKSFFYEATMSAGKLSPLADFGSQRNGVYDVILVYSRPHVETIGNILHTYGVSSNCPIVIFAGRMTAVQRQEWSNYCMRRGLTALLVDELLLYYLASQRESRLPALISCGAAWGYLVPYRSFGLIPPEIFKGRNLMVKELAKPGGSCIVYGGRQFGKTAILHMVQREYDNPERGVYVIYDDIKPLGDPLGHYRPDDIWSRLREMLIEKGILYEGIRHDREHISQKIIEKLNNNKTMQVIVLLDESDYFLAADAKHNFEEVHALRRIMDQTERRFKVVFCGLHSVQRYCSGQNHPFAQMMSRPLVIGPLEPAEARSLITEPMEAIGFSFDGDESRNAVLRILCYTNYHPALIQYFCGELIKLVRKRQQEPPYRVSIADVEGIYRREDVRNFMRERFNWTLDLDSRYLVMVYSMIAEQLHEKDGYRREFTVSEALECAADWWPRGFASVSLDEAKALLDELIGLGVLVKRINGKYRLKNGNVVRALGSEQEIFERLLSMAEQPAPDIVDDALCYRLKINSRERSPLTVKQASELTEACSGMGIVFGSAATGITAVPHTLKFLMGSNFSEKCQPLPPDIVTLDQLFRLFSNSISRKQAGRDLFYTFARDLPILDTSLADTVCNTSRFLSKYRRRSSIIRWIIIFDAFATRKWFESSPKNWMKAENLVGAMVYLMRWDKEVIEKYLDDFEIPYKPQVIEDIYKVTGGWPYLLNELWELMELMKDPTNVPDPLKAAHLLKEKLADNTDGIADGFLAAMGVDEVECGLEIVNMFKELGPISRNEIDDGIKTYGNAKLLQLSPDKLQVSLQTLHRLNVLVKSEEGLEVEPVASGVIGKR